ncbi:MAG: glutathione S-transferase family protein [Pseudomonadota bacterium]
MDQNKDEFSAFALSVAEKIVPQKRRTLISTTNPQSKLLLDLYHFGFSICSHKVRAVLAELGLSWRSLELDPRLHENYNPDYVRLRLMSSQAKNSKAANGWEGGSSVTESGFDALVVPTLVDYQHHEVLADSLQICLHLARKHTEKLTLLPATLEDEILSQLEIVDRTAHVALLYGANPNGDGRSYLFRNLFKGEHVKKAEAAKQAWDPIIGESEKLDAVYHAKVSKELAGRDFVASEEKMRETIHAVSKQLVDFSLTLHKKDGKWICGDAFTIADIFWGVSLFRLEFLGYEWMYRNNAELKNISTFADEMFKREAFKKAVCEWPSHPWSNPASKWLPKPSLSDRIIGLGSKVSGEIELN